MNKTALRIIAALAALAALLALGGCGGKKEEPAADDSLKKVMDAGKLVLRLDASFPPMGYVGDGGEIVGFDIDVAQEVCDRMGIELVKQPIDWDAKEEKLNGGEIDCIWNGMSGTASRAEAMNLSETYMKNEMIFVVPKSSAIKSMNGLREKAVGVQAGSTAQELLEASELYGSLRVTLFEDNVELLNALALGNLDAAFLDSIVAYFYISSEDAAFYVLPGNLGEEDYAIGFRKGDQTLRDRVQQVLSELNEDGKLGEISVRWFGSDITSMKK